MNKSYYYRLQCISVTSGFTLLELLIAISLTAILMTVLVVGLNLIVRDWEKHGKHLDQKLDESLILLQIEKSILGIFAYQYKENNLAQEQLFFSGNANELLWISTVSPNRNGGLSLWQIKVNEKKGLQLRVLPVYPGDPNKQLEKQAEQKPSEYFTDYSVSLHYLFADSANKKQWLDSWQTKDEQALPLGIRLTFTANDASQISDSNYQQFNIFSFIRVNSTGGIGGGGPFGDVRQGGPIRNINRGGNSGTSNSGGLF